MRKIREVLRLKFEVGLSACKIAVSVQIGRVTVGDYLNRFAASGIAWLLDQGSEATSKLDSC